jgi:hypothetical protein
MSGPQGERISEEDCMAIIENLPSSIDRLILSGGEPIADKKKLYMILDRLKEKYQGKTQIMLQTNGDLLTDEILDTLIEKGVTRFDIASIDRYHKAAGGRIMQLAELFESRGVNGEDRDPLVTKDNYVVEHELSWGYWGATEEMWLGGNWARGRAYQKNIWLKDPNHNFCGILSGAVGFLNGADNIPQEISIQLYKINPCCPGTKEALGDARVQKISDVLERISTHSVFEKLDKGDPYRMGESVGVSEEHARKRCGELKNVCLWCDEFFDQHFDIKTLSKKES